MPNIRTRFKVYSADGEHRASTVIAYDAALLALWDDTCRVYYATQSRRVLVWDGASETRNDAAFSDRVSDAGALMADRVALWRAERRPLSASAFDAGERL